MKKSFRIAVVLWGACLVCLVSLPAGAQPSVVPDLMLNAPGLGVAFTNTPEAAAFRQVTDGKAWELATPMEFVAPSALRVVVQELRYDPDPLVYNSVLVQNLSGLAQTYTFSVALPTTFAAPSLIRGSIDTSLIGTDGLVSAVPNFSIYSAQIDFATVRTLQDAPFALSTPQSAVSSSAAFGFELNNVAVNSSMGIQLRFTLSPGDTATIVSDFEIVPVPEPGVASLVLLGGGLVAWLRRRG